jgi:hypothetical protein
MAEEPRPPSDPPDQEELETGIDFADPLKRDANENEEMPGLDPVVTLPPE